MIYLILLFFLQASHPCPRAAQLPDNLADAAATLRDTSYPVLNPTFKVALLAFLCDEVCASTVFSKLISSRVRQVLEVENDMRNELAQEKRDSRSAEAASKQKLKDEAGAAETCSSSSGNGAAVTGGSQPQQKGAKKKNVLKQKKKEVNHTLASVQKLLTQLEMDKILAEKLVDRGALLRRRNALRTEELRLRSIERELLEEDTRKRLAAQQLLAATQRREQQRATRAREARQKNIFRIQPLGRDRSSVAVWVLDEFPGLEGLVSNLNSLSYCDLITATFVRSCISKPSNEVLKMLTLYMLQFHTHDIFSYLRRKHRRIWNQVNTRSCR